MMRPEHRRFSDVVRRAMLVGLCWSPTAFAAPGDHIKVGKNTTLTPAITAGVEGRSNAYLAQQDGDKNEPVRSAFNFFLSPSFDVETRGPKVRWDLNLSWQMRKFFDAEIAQDLDTYEDFRARTQLDVLTTSPVGFTLRDSARLATRPTDEQVSDDARNRQFRNELGADIRFRPGPELEIAPGFTWAFHDYIIPGASLPQRFDTRQTYEPSIGLSWRFFPNTAFVVDASYGMNRWDVNWVPTRDPGLEVDPVSGAVTGLGEYLAKPDSDIFKATTGVRGRLGKNVLLVLTAGWGFGNYDPGSVTDEAEADPGIGNEADPVVSGFERDVSPTDGILVHARVESDWGFQRMSTFGQRFTVQYRKDFSDSFFTNYVHQHHAQATLESRFTKWFSTRFDGSVRFESYVGEIARRDIVARVEGAFIGHPTRYLDLTLAAFWNRRQSNDEDVEYDNVQGRFLVTFVY